MRCWYVRWQISNALDRGDLASYRTRGHPARCRACQAFAASLVALDGRLARDAHLAIAPVAARRARWPLWLGAPLAAAVATGALVFDLGERPVMRAVDPAPAIQVSDALVQVHGIVDRVSQALTRTPLETELDDLIHDSKRGLDAVLDAGGLR